MKVNWRRFVWKFVLPFGSGALLLLVAGAYASDAGLFTDGSGFVLDLESSLVGFILAYVALSFTVFARNVCDYLKSSD